MIQRPFALMNKTYLKQSRRRRSTKVRYSLSHFLSLASAHDAPHASEQSGEGEKREREKRLEHMFTDYSARWMG